MTTPLEGATTRLLATVEGMPPAGWQSPSLCAGWTRAHVIAHLALNAEALDGVVRGLAGGRPVPMYVSDDARNADIADLAVQPTADVLDRLRTAAAALDRSLPHLATLPQDAIFERTPGGPRVRAAGVLLMRLGEVEIHHADLDAGYTHAHWPAETAVALLDRDAARHPGESFVAHATDLDREWTFGDPGDDAPVVSGPASALAWWATGRDPGTLLSSSTGSLPTMEGR
ncbi:MULTISPECIES: maleylpyruvate isomerase family mycothiol-dependent enzyme [Nocardioides]|uniref:Maleylpyruvate isomerase family mycothiol-dependent enzyme n=1 Tax=Nocardioides vastitatis TaxID=2568655 RepID=A0ABW0ZH16_9ACTN|nr:maleylpyruvate isomerase family mycothiol-dependent enzyme [Nocardioides sp.]